MPIIATEPNHSISLFVLSQVLSLRIAEKLLSHSAEIMENVHVIFNRTNTLGNLSSLHFLIAYISGRSLEATINYLRCQSRCSWSTTFLFIKCSSCSFKIGEISTLSLDFSEHETDGVKMSNLTDLQLNLLKRCVISKKKWINNC